jgi:MSHA biogenesis protein MshP
MTRQHETQKGFAALAAIFLVVVLAALGGFMLTFSNAQHRTSAQDVQGSRAYWAASAGVEWGLGSAVAGIVNCPAPPDTLKKTLVIDAFTVVVACTSRAFTEASVTRSIYQITSVASSSGGTAGSLGYIERSVSASLEK